MPSFTPRTFLLSVIGLLLMALSSCQTPQVVETVSPPAMVQGPVVKTLDNGLRLVVTENHTAPVAALRIYVHTGSIYEQEYMGMGISHVFEHLINGGTTTTRSEDEITEMIDWLGGANNAYTTRGHTAYYITTSADKIGEAVELMSDWMKNCTFPQKEVDRELGVVMEELRKGKEEPRRILGQALYETLFDTHPARYPVIGYEELVSKITRDQIVDYYERMYVPNNMVVSIAGDFDADEVIAQAEKALGGLERRPLPEKVLAQEPPQMGRRERTVYKDGLGGAYVYVVFRTVALQHPDLYPLDVLSHILSNGNSSRLTRTLRDEKRLVNMVTSYSATPEYGAGFFAVYAMCEDGNVEATVEEILTLVYEARESTVTEAELKKAIRQKAAENVFGRQTAEDEAASFGTSLLNTGNVNFDDVYLAGIRQVTPEEIQRVAKTWFHDDNLTVVTMRPTPPKATETTATAMADTAETPTRKVVLPNGMTVLLKRNPNVPVVNFQAMFMGGTRLEPAGKEGVSQFTTSMLSKGTTSRSAIEIAEAFDSIGGSIGSTSGNNTFGVSADVLTEDFDTGLTILADVIQNATFPEQEFTTMQANTLSALARMTDNWQSELSYLFRKNWFTEHPYARIPLGTPESVKAMTPADLKAFYTTHMVPSRGVLTVYGDIDPEAVEAKVRAAFAGFTRPAGELPTIGPQPVPTEARSVDEPRQRHISALYMGYPGIAITDREDLFALTVLDAVLSGIGFPGGRLQNALRGGDNQLVYLVHAFNFYGLEPGYFGIMAASSPDKMDQVEAIILAHVEKIKAETVPAEELAKAKTICNTMDKLDRQTNGSMALQAALDELYGLGHENYKSYTDGINKVTAADVQRVARKYLTHPLILRTGPELKKE